MSTRPSNSASSISLVKSPLPPMSARGWPRILSPVVLMMQISSAPSSARCGKAALRGGGVGVELSRLRKKIKIRIEFGEDSDGLKARANVCA